MGEEGPPHPLTHPRTPVHQTTTLQPSPLAWQAKFSVFSLFLAAHLQPQLLTAGVSQIMPAANTKVFIINTQKIVTG